LCLDGPAALIHDGFIKTLYKGIACAAPSPRGLLMALRVGLIGIGIMGLPMARNLALGGARPVLHDIDAAARARAAAIEGAELVASPASVAEKSDIIFTCLSSEAAVRDVYLGADGIAASARSGLITCECSTISAEFAQDLSAAIAARGVRHLETPLVGRKAQAEARQLYFLVAGDTAVLPEVEPALKLMGRAWRHVGPSGTASRIKLLQNGLGYAAGVAATEILGLCRALAIDPEIFVEIVNEAGGIGGSTYFREHAEDVVHAREAGSGRLYIAAKDMHLLMAMARASQLPLPVLAETERIYGDAVDSGLASEEYTAIWRILEKRAGRELFGALRDKKRGRGRKR
jgi:3-hydroxyisobutyrate dehydrogenase-like beta-hydroxyacid dehydrogenase